VLFLHVCALHTRKCCPGQSFKIYILYDDNDDVVDADVDDDKLMILLIMMMYMKIKMEEDDDDGDYDNELHSKAIEIVSVFSSILPHYCDLNLPDSYVYAMLCHYC